MACCLRLPAQSLAGLPLPNLAVLMFCSALSSCSSSLSKLHRHDNRRLATSIAPRSFLSSSALLSFSSLLFTLPAFLLITFAALIHRILSTRPLRHRAVAHGNNHHIPQRNHPRIHARYRRDTIIIHLASIILRQLHHLISSSSFHLAASPTSAASFPDPDKADEEQALRLPFSIE
ncbi:hypothetical protein L207DRAFT_580218 [Hyaloscypha variabilis F]|uniref:Uncharacterized protein n=1 Tax=Hyaloscypha variabilis (strain UAMH 11265 / GT02V1 / F) TaxID=1149755 RepID=A0A2J6RXX9_HYAVF|nr:hypothetical protein L207DRAFT_580218 [Hyaloscypha variabilis F]